MRRAMAAVFVLCFVGLTGGCSGEHEKNTNEQVELYGELNEVLEGIIDEVTLEAALPLLEELNRKIQANDEARAKLDAQDEKDIRKGRKEFGKELAELNTRRGGLLSGILKNDKIKQEARDKLLKAVKDIDMDT